MFQKRLLSLGSIIGGSCLMYFDYHLMGSGVMAYGLIKYAIDEQLYNKLMIEYYKTQKMDPLAKTITSLITEELVKQSLVSYDVQYYQFLYNRKSHGLERNKKLTEQEDSYKFIQKNYDFTCRFVDQATDSKGIMHGDVTYNHPESYSIKYITVDFIKPTNMQIVIRDLYI